MKSSAPWSVKGIERDARETAKEAAKREGMTVGEWLNQMIYSAGDPTPSDGNIEGLKLRDLVTAIEHLHQRVAEADTKNAGAVADLTRNLGGAVERVQRLERVKPSEGSHEDLSARLEKLERDGGDRQRVDALKALEKAVAQVAVQFNNAHKTSVERLDSTERQLQELAARIDQMGGGNEDTSGVTFLKNAVDGLSIRIARTERIASEAAKLKNEASAAADPEFVERTGNRLRVLGDEIKRGGDQIQSLEAIIGKLSEQIEAAERRSSEGVQKVAETIADLREQFSSENDRDAARADMEAAVTAARQETDERITALQESFNDMLARLSSLGAAQMAQDGGALTAEALDDADHGEDSNEPVAPPAFDIDEDTETDASAELETGDGDIGNIDEKKTVAATTEENSNQEDGDEEDPFAFADEIDAPKDSSEKIAAQNSDQDDDFSFELDDDNETVARVPSEAEALLSEVQEVFGKKQQTSDNETGAVEHAKDHQEDDIDALLADLDDLSDDEAASDEKPVEAAEDDKEQRPAAKALLAGEQPSLTKETADEAAPEEAEDFMKTARRRAKEAAERAAQEEKPKRRKLTPKQKAILAARARQKRKAAEQSKTDDDRAALEKPGAAASDKPAADAGEDEEEERGPIAKFAAMFSSIGNRFSRAKAEEEDETETIAPAEETTTSKNGNRAAFSTLKTTAAARPLTLTLGVGIFLALAALFFLVKDIVFKPNTPASRPAVTKIETQVPAAAADITADVLPVVPEAPAIDPQALYLESVAALSAAETDEATTAAISKLQEAAALGHPPAQLQLGELYKTGQGVEQDLGQARTWFRRAANGGNVLAMHRIGVMTARGDGGAADTSEAIGWFELAANRGLVDSQYNLGAIYHPSGDGSTSTIQDPGKAYFWYSLAAKNGDEQAGSLAAGVAASLTPAQRKEIDAKIDAWTVEPSDAAANQLTAIE